MFLAEKYLLKTNTNLIDAQTNIKND